MATRDKELIEGNARRDAYWGFDFFRVEGRNRLGKTPMKIRAELRR